MIETLKHFVEDYNTSCESVCAKMAVEGSDVPVAICSPLMKRAHELLRSSGEVVFVDSSGNMDFENTRVFLFVTASVAGGLPLGVVFTTSEATYPLTNAFKLLQEILPEQAFYNRGKDGPKIFMTDDSASERISLRSCFKAPDLILFLCKFHYLSAVWKFLLDPQHGVKAASRPELYFLFKQLLNCTDIDKFNAMYDEFLQLRIVKEHQKFREHIQKKQRTAQEWAMAYRQDIITRGHDTNNYNEVCTKVIKDQILHRVKAYSTVQLFDFMTVSLDAYFKRRLADCLSNRMASYRSSRYFIPEEKIASLTATKMSDDIYIVHNAESDRSYRVDLTTDVCSCPVGVNGAPCKHQYFLTKFLMRSSSQFLPLNDPEAKLILHKIMNGSTSDVREGWYESHKTSGWSDSLEATGSISTAEETSQSAEMISENKAKDVDAAAISLCSDQFDRMCEDMKKRLEERPEAYLPAYQCYMRRYEECSKSENSYLSAFFTFNRAVGHASLKGWTMKRIPVQPTAIGRRTKYFGGHHAQIPGRPYTTFKNSEGTSKKRTHEQEPNYAHLPKKRRAPHSLSRCVLRNVPSHKN